MFSSAKDANLKSAQALLKSLKKRSNAEGATAEISGLLKRSD